MNTDKSSALLYLDDKELDNWLIRIRPNTLEFFDKIMRIYDVAFWSCMSRQKIDSYLDLLFDSEQQEHFKFIYSIKESYKTGYRAPRSPHSHIFLKPLSVVWAQFPQYNQTNTILIEDNIHRTFRNPKWTSLFPFTYFGSIHDKFLLDIFLPCLRKMAETRDSQLYLRGHEPKWSIDTYQDAVKYSSIYRLLMKKGCKLRIAEDIVLPKYSVLTLSQEEIWSDQQQVISQLVPKIGESSFTFDSLVDMAEFLGFDGLLERSNVENI